jgi:hypothetical protein
MFKTGVPALDDATSQTLTAYKGEVDATSLGYTGHPSRRTKRSRSSAPSRSRPFWLA